MKAIIFDVDGVIIISAEEKDRRIKEVLVQNDLYDVEWVQEILTLSLNRVIMLERIYKLVSFDKKRVLQEINIALEEVENNPVWNPSVIEFIKNNYKNYIFFTNTSLPRKWLQRILELLGIIDCFKELLSGEDGMKLDNINYIMRKYNLSPEEVLFIDDTISHIDRVKVSWVNLLHFNNSDMNIEDEVKEY